MTTQSGMAEQARDSRRREMLSVETVAEMLDCSPRHVRRLADSGRMPAPIKLGALIRWPRAPIYQWIEDGCPNCGTTTGEDRQGVARG